jgi:hypothetical protein
MATKARAYVTQARADFDAYVASGEANEASIGEHHRLQLLQMALEKLSKSILYHAEPEARYSHPSFIAHPPPPHPPLDSVAAIDTGTVSSATFPAFSSVMVTFSRYRPMVRSAGRRSSS